MNTQLIPISLILLSALYAGVGLLIWSRRPGLAITPFSWVLFSVATWSLGYGLELLTPILNGKLFWLKVEFFGVASIAGFLLSFSAAYTGRKKLLTPRNQFLLWIVPSITLLLVWTNSYHHLIWRELPIGEDTSLLYAFSNFGNWFWLQIFYSFALLLVTIIFLVLEFIQSPKPYKLQSGIVLLGILFPLAGGLLYLLGDFIPPGLDITPYSFIPTVLVMTWGTLRYRLLSVLPAAPSMILHELEDGVIVVDIRKRILYVNTMAEQLLHIKAENVIGQPIESVQVVPLEILQGLIEGKITYTEQEFIFNGQNRVFDIHVSPLLAKNWGTHDTDASHLITLRDIHERKLVELDLQHRQRTLNMLHEIVVSALQTTDRQSMAQTIVNSLGDLIDSDGCFLSLFDEVSEKFTPLAAYGLYSKAYLSLTTQSSEPTLTASALDEGRTLVVEDISNTPYLSSRIAALLPFHSVMTLPLIAGQKKFGAILLAYSESHHFQPEEISIGEQAAGLIALTLEKFYAVEDASKRAEESETLRKAGAAVAATLRSEEAIDRILEQLSLVIPYDSASVQLLRSDELEIVGGRGWKNPKDVLGLRFPIPGDNPNTVVVQTGKPCILGDAVKAHSSFREEGPHIHIRSWLGVPLIVREQIIGLLAIDSKEQNYFTEEHVKTVTTFSDQVAIALENARLFEETQNQLQEQIMLRDASTIISSALDKETILSKLTEQLSLAIDVTSAYINEYNNETDAYIVVAEYISPKASIDEQRSDLGAIYPAGRNEDGFIKHMQLGEIDLSHIDDPDLSETDRKHMQEYGAKSVLYVPLRVKGQLVGFAELWESRRKREFSADEINICKLLAQQTAVAIANARLFEEVQNLAFTDALTGLYNRRGLFEIGHIEFTRMSRLDRPFSVIMIDIDHFKRVNDQYGHPVGDQVLQFLASEFRSVVRGTDIVGRYGGEEFAIFLSGSDGSAAMELAERLRAMIEKTPFHVGENRISLTISLGVTEYNENSPNLETLVARADQALYVAKHKGRNRVILGK